MRTLEITTYQRQIEKQKKKKYWKIIAIKVKK